MPGNSFPQPTPPPPPEDGFPAASTSETLWHLLCHPVGHGHFLSDEVWILILGMGDHFQAYFFLESFVSAWGTGCFCIC